MSLSAKMGGRTFTLYASNNADTPKDVFFGGFAEKNFVYVSKSPPQKKIPESGCGYIWAISSQM